jgi:hypothetical protein
MSLLQKICQGCQRFNWQLVVIENIRFYTNCQKLPSKPLADPLKNLMKSTASKLPSCHPPNGGQVALGSGPAPTLGTRVFTCYKI